MAKQISVIVVTYNRPENLERVLVSIAKQEGVDGKFELIVSDDGSTDHTPAVVEQFGKSVDFPVRFVTHPDRGFELSRTRNDGVRASEGDFILLIDGDCAVPPDHVATHFNMRSKGVVRGLETPVWLSEAQSSRIDLASIDDGTFLSEITWRQRFELKKRAFRSSFYSLMRHPRKPRILGGNMGLFREDYERVNGCDERFVGWGHEDDDLNARMRAVGMRPKSIIGKTYTCHLWHPVAPSRPNDPARGKNVCYLHRPVRLSKCMQGLTKRDWRDVTMSLNGTVEEGWMANVVSGMPFNSVRTDGEIDVICVDDQSGFGVRSFNDAADCKILICKDVEDLHHQLVCEADVLITQSQGLTVKGDPHTYMDQVGDWDRITAWMAGTEESIAVERAA
ncbi:MAG: glycosyltransferase [Pirellulaceae bacterium]